MTQPFGRNDTTADNQQHLDPQNPSENAKQPFTTTTRPKLKRTRSSLFYSKRDHIAAAAVGHHSIQLPSGIEDRIIGNATSPVLSHVWHAASIGSIMCLVASIRITLTHESPALVLYVLGWAATLLWIRTAIGHQQQHYLDDNILLSWALSFSILSAIHFLSFYYSNTLNLSHLTIPAVLLFFFARNVHTTHTQLQHDTRQRIQDEVRAAQTWINQSTATITNTRLQLLETITQEVKGASSIITSTLEQFTPASVLAHPDELLSACTIAVPTTSISAIHTAIKQINHINSNIDLAASLLTSEDKSLDGTKEATVTTTTPVKFDMGVLVQSVGDALAGMAANSDVHLVIYHMDNGLHYGNVLGNEEAIRHTLIDIICRIMEERCTPGATIEVGLAITSLPDDDACLKRITFDIVHTCSPAIPITLSSDLIPNSRFTAQLMQYMGGDMTVEEIERGRTRFCLTIDVQAAPRDDDDHRHFAIDTSMSGILRNKLTDTRSTNETTHKELERFVESQLKCLKMVLHAPEQSVFATHLTRYLTNLNADISHVPITRFPARQDPVGEHQQPQIQPPTPTGEPIFVLIDDDMLTLERLLFELRLPPTPLSVSDKAIQQKQQHRHGNKGSHMSSVRPTGVAAIICFVSLDKFKQARCVVRSFVSQHPFAMPRVIVIPKPAGPLRFLTALHTAWYNPIVEPHYFPIATSPLSPMTSLATEPFASGLTTPSEGRHQRSYSPASANDSSPSSSSRRQHQEQKQRRASPDTTPPWAGQQYFSLPEATTAAAAAAATAGAVVSTDPDKDNRPVRLRSLSGTFFERNGETRLDALATPWRRPQAMFDDSGDDEDGEDGHTGHLDQGQEEKLVMIGPLPSLADESPSDIKGIAATGKTKTPPITSATPIEPTRPSRRFITRNKKRNKRTPFSGTVNPPINVLIVEDNKINQVILQTWMKKHNIKHASATNGQEAVEKWKKGGFHLVLMDLQLPIMSGIDATRMIRSIEREQHIGVLPAAEGAGNNNTDTVPAAVDAGPSSTPFRSPVIIVALTASSLESDRHAALAAGCNDFLTKPVSLEWLEKKIVEWGCMQALIDFDGWRRWRQSISCNNPNMVISAITGPASAKTIVRRLSKQKEDQTQYQVRPSPISNSRRAISMEDGILLPGVGENHGRPPKRNASMDDVPLQRGGDGGGGAGAGAAAAAASGGGGLSLAY